MRQLRRLLKYLASYRLVVGLGLLAVILPVAMELLVPRVLQYIIDSGILGGSMQVIWSGSAVMLAAAVLGSAATIGQGICRALLSQGLSYDIRNDLFKHTLSLSFARLDQLQTGGLMTRISSDVDLVRGFSSHGIALILRAILMIVGSLVMVFLMDPSLALFMVAGLAIATALIVLFASKVRPLFAGVQAKLSELNTVLQESLAGIHVVKAFVRERFEVERFAQQSDDYTDRHIRVGRITALVTPILTLLTNASVVAVLVFGGRDVVVGRLTTGELVAFINFFMIGMTPLMLLGNFVAMISRAEASAERILEVLDMEPGLTVAGESYRPSRVRGELAVEGVRFRYATQDQSDSDILDGVSFEAKRGRQVALLGATGSGKSTLVHLIPRFYDVTGGSIRVDGIDVRDWDPEALRGLVSLVMQQPVLFAGTIHENIAFGRPSASRDEVTRVAMEAQAHEFIMEMPGGYDARVESRGSNLSGGQKQRITIARALLTNPAILILDDSTSAVDVETEFKIQQALAARERKPSSIIIAQRINSVLHADRILVLEEGRVVSYGTHAELMETSVQYQEIYQSQFGEIGHG